MQVLLRLPDDLATRFKATVPKKSRSAFVADLLRKALPAEADDALYRLALAVEGDPELSEMASEWDSAAGDGIEAR
ncbi:MAG: hypothetical protein NTX45_30255 [Proteobacteria bacterium]|nr:hypothetical protein [Pseudomonadota bacterium]